MPRPSDLPPDLSALTRRNAWELSDARWSYDLSRLCNAIQRVVDQAQPTMEPPTQPRHAQQAESLDHVDADISAASTDPSDATAGTPPLSWGASVLLATLVLAAGLLLPARKDTTTMLHWGAGEAVGVVILALLLAGAAMLGRVRAPALAGSAFGLGLAGFLMRLVVVLKPDNFDDGSLKSPGTFVTLLATGSLLLMGAVWAHRLSSQSGGYVAHSTTLGNGVSDIAIRTAAISTAFLGIALRTQSMSLPLRVDNNIVLAQDENVRVGLLFFIATCIMTVLVLVWLSAFKDAFIACLIGFGAQVLLRLQFPPVANGQSGGGGLADQILWIALGALLVAALIRGLLEPKLARAMPAGWGPTIS